MSKPGVQPSLRDVNHWRTNPALRAGLFSVVLRTRWSGRYLDIGLEDIGALVMMRRPDYIAGPASLGGKGGGELGGMTGGGVSSIDCADAESKYFFATASKTQ